MPIRSRMTSIMGQIEPEQSVLFALEFVKIAECDCLHSIIYKYQPIRTKLGQIVCDHKSLIMDLIRPELSKLSALELENLPYLNLFKMYHLQILTNQYQTWPQYICP